MSSKEALELINAKMAELRKQKSAIKKIDNAKEKFAQKMFDKLNNLTVKGEKVTLSHEEKLEIAKDFMNLIKNEGKEES